MSALIVRVLLCEKHEKKSCDLDIRTNSFGKPYLHHPCGWQYNVSHSGEWVVCALDNQPVGVDVEQVKPLNDEWMIRLLSPEEADELGKQPPGRRLSFFYERWTLKESYLKAVGSGLNDRMNELSLAHVQGEYRMASHDGRLSEWKLQLASLDAQYPLSVCYLSCFQGDVVHVPVEEWIKRFLAIV